jgi:hypothetical protein
MRQVIAATEQHIQYTRHAGSAVDGGFIFDEAGRIFDANEITIAGTRWRAHRCGAALQPSLEATTTVVCGGVTPGSLR